MHEKKGWSARDVTHERPQPPRDGNTLLRSQGLEVTAKATARSEAKTTGAKEARRKR